jgi:hypothetical protein
VSFLSLVEEVDLRPYLFPNSITPLASSVLATGVGPAGGEEGKAGKLEGGREGGREGGSEGRDLCISF